MENFIIYKEALMLVFFNFDTTKKQIIFDLHKNKTLVFLKKNTPIVLFHL
jgi:hypothetical protein